MALLGRSTTSSKTEAQEIDDVPPVWLEDAATSSDEQKSLLKKSNRLLEAVLAILDVNQDIPTKKDSAPYGILPDLRLPQTDSRLWNSYPHRYTARTGLFSEPFNAASSSASPATHLASSQPKSTSSSKGPASGATTGEDWSGKENDEETEINAALVAAVTGMRSLVRRLSNLVRTSSLSHRAPHIIESCVRTNSSHWVLSRKLDDLAHTTPSISTEVYLVLPPKIGKEGSIIDAEEEMRALERRLRLQASS